MVKKNVLSLLAAFAISTPVFAADTGGYLFGVFGQTKLKDSIDTTGITNPSLDDTGTGIKIGGGYAFHRNVGIEVAYVDLGKATLSGRVGTINISETFKASGLVVTAVGMVPINQQFSLLGRLGFINATVKDEATASLGSVSASASVKSTDMKMTFGIGVSYSFTPQFAVRADYDSYNKLGDNDTTGENTVDMISVGVVYKF
jgi:OOP family OmpA-OmpF porin